MSLKTKDSKKRKFLRFMKGTVQSRLLAKALNFRPPSWFCPAPGIFRALPEPRRTQSRPSVEEAVGRIVVRFVRHGYL